MPSPYGSRKMCLGDARPFTDERRGGDGASVQPVADAPHVDHPAAAIALELAAQTTGMAVDGSGRSARSVSPDGAQQLLLGEDTLRVARQVGKQLELESA